jgi:hypothetical protein
LAKDNVLLTNIANGMALSARNVGVEYKNFGVLNYIIPKVV